MRDLKRPEALQIMVQKKKDAEQTKTKKLRDSEKSETDANRGGGKARCVNTARRRDELTQLCMRPEKRAPTLLTSPEKTALKGGRPNNGTSPGALHRGAAKVFKHTKFLSKGQREQKTCRGHGKSTGKEPSKLGKKTKKRVVCGSVTKGKRGRRTKGPVVEAPTTKREKPTHGQEGKVL